MPEAGKILSQMAVSQHIQGALASDHVYQLVTTQEIKTVADALLGGAFDAPCQH